jgi:hypothetical protein
VKPPISSGRACAASAQLTATDVVPDRPHREEEDTRSCLEAKATWAPGTSRPDFAPVGAQPLPEAKMFGRVNAIAVKLKGELKGTQQPIGTPPGAAAARQFRHCLAARYRHLLRHARRALG